MFLLVQAGAWLKLPDGFAGDPDNLMRLVALRDLLKGQDWFDPTQYRLLPPDGVEMHWSRLIDGALAALVLALRPVLGPTGAEIAAGFLWPALLMVAFLGVIRAIAEPLFGPRVAAFAMLSAALSPIFSRFYFAAGTLDHHNLQILCAAIVIWGLTAPARPTLAGAAAGSAAALSFAVGLEMAGVAALAPAILLWRYVWDGPDELARLLSYGILQAVVAVILFAVQSPPSAWLTARCDQLSWPFLLPIAVGGACVMALPPLASRFSRRRGRGLAVGILAICAAAVAFPALWVCRAGPYAAIPPDIRRVVVDAVIENLSVLTILVQAPPMGLILALSTALCLCLLLFRRHADELPATRAAVETLAAFLALGLVAGLYQARLLIWAFPALPLGMGLVFADIAGMRGWHPKRIFQAAMVAVLIYPPLVLAPLVAVRMVNDPPARSAEPSGAASVNYNDAPCRTADGLAQLAGMPPALVMTPLNMGPAVLAFTDHAVTGASYHRSPAALGYGVLPFLGKDTDMLRAMDETGAVLVVACHGQNFGPPDSAGTRLANGQPLPGLMRIDTGQTPLRIYRKSP